MELFSNVQSWWELPSIAHFCSLFRAAFDLLDFDIEELEEAIITDGLDGSGSPLLAELLVRLLHGCLPGRTVTPSNVDSCLRKLFRQKCQETSLENLFPEGEFRHLTLRRKVEVLHALCDFRLEAEDVLDLLKNLETESLRIEPLGYDDRGSTFWYFYGTRLYREDNSLYHPFRRRPRDRDKEKDKEDKRKKKRKRKGLRDSGEEEEDEEEEEEGEEEEDTDSNVTWQVQCYTEDDWKKLAERFASCESRLEKSLLQTLKEDFLPEIPRLFEEKDKIQQKRMLEFAPRRSSGRVQKLKEKKEEEERKLAEELVEQEKMKMREEEKRRAQDERDINRLPEEEKEEESFHEEEENKIRNEEKKNIPEVKRRFNDRKERKKRKLKELYDDERVPEISEDVLHERNLCQDLPLRSPCSPKPKQRRHREKKIHHRKHHGHRKKMHGHHLKNSAPSTLDPSMEDNQIVSDTSNKENTCLLEALSENEENIESFEASGRPQVYSGRKTNNSLSSIAFSLSPATVVPEPPTQMVSSPPNKRRIKSAHSLLQTADDLKTGMYKVLEHLRDHEDAWPFLDPVDDNFAPNYYAVIRRPMYISKMECRLDNEHYSHLSMFEADFKLMMDNCKLYNGPESEYTHMAYTLEKVFAKLKTKYLETDLSSDDEIYIDMSFQESSKRKNRKRNSTTEENDKDNCHSSEKKKRGRKKKKVGRKPKKLPDELNKPAKSPRKAKSRSPTERKDKDKPKNKSALKHPKEALPDEGSYNDEEEKHERDVKLNDAKEELEEEDEDDDEDDFEEPLLLVREDPYPENEEEDEERNSTLGHSSAVSDDDHVFKEGRIGDIIRKGCSLPKKWKNSLREEYKRSSLEPELSTLAAANPSDLPQDFTPSIDRHIVDDDDDDDGEEDEDHNEEIIQKVYNHQTNKKKKELDKKKDKKIIEDKGKRKSKNCDIRKTRGKNKQNRSSEKHKSSTKSLECSTNGESHVADAVAVASDSDVDSDRDGVLLYYSNNEDCEDKDERKKDYLSEKHNELFGETDDIEDEEANGRDCRKAGGVAVSPKDGENCEKSSHAMKHSKKDALAKEKKKHKHAGDKHSHHHHHHHHHKNKAKEGKHHHHHHKKKPKYISGKDSPSKKVLKVEEVYDVSEEDPNPRDSGVREKDQIPNKSTAKDLNLEEGKPLGPLPREGQKESINKKKKIRRKTKHDKHSKHDKKKENKQKVKSVKKDNKKKSTKRKKKSPAAAAAAAPNNMAAIDALSAATEQTLKDITVLLEDPEVPRFTGESPIAGESSPSHKVTSQEFEEIAMKIESDYRKRLKMDSTEEKKSRKKKRRKSEDENGPKKKKVIKEKGANNTTDDKEKENRSDSGSLDNIKEMFKDIKDGRIKPGAIIKSKDIAKKEGVVKKESKASIEGKPKNKQNPFGKINKQENSKLTTLIAKAKESRIGLVPNSEVGDSPMLSLGSIILFGDIGTGKHSSREPNSADEEEKIEKISEKLEKWDSPWENRWEKPELKDESSLPIPLSADEEEEKEEIEVVCEASPERPVEEIQPPMTPRAPEIKQERATPNLSAWFRAFGAPKLTAAPRKKMDGRTDDDDDDDDAELIEEGEEERLEEAEVCTHHAEENKDEEDEIDVEDRKEIEREEEKEVNKCKDVVNKGNKISRKETLPEEAPLSPRPVVNNSPEPPLSPEKPPETPWFDKLEDKGEEPIWKKNKSQEEEDPYKFEEEELDRAREEAKKLEVERQRKASVSSSGLSDPSPLNIDSDRSPAAFSSEGERSPLTKSPATRSPLTPGFGSAKQISPVTEKSPTIPAYSPRYDSGLSKGFSSYDNDKNKYQANGTLKVGFYQDMTDKASQEKSEAAKSLDQKAKESPIYSPTVPYVSPFYSNKDPNLCKQKSPGRYGTFYSALDPALDKPKTPAYYPASAPSTPSDRPSPAAPLSEDKPKSQYNYYNYDPTKPLTDQYKNTGSSTAKPFFGGNDGGVKNLDQSPSGQGTPLRSSLGSPVQMGITPAKSAIIPDKTELQPPKKRQIYERMTHQHTNINSQQSCSGGLSSNWESKADNLDVDRSVASSGRNSFPQHPLPANLANLSQIVSRIPEPESDYVLPEKDVRLSTDHHQSHQTLQMSSKAVQPSLPYGGVVSLSQPPPDIQPMITNRSGDLVRAVESDHSSVPDLTRTPLLQQINSTHLHSQSPINPHHHITKQIASEAVSHPHPSLSHLQPPAAHQKNIEVERPGSRNMPPPHPEEKSHGYLHQKTMWTSSLPSSISSSLSSSLSSLVTNATMASFALAGQKGFTSLSSEQLAQLSMDRATLASLAGDRTSLASLAGRAPQNGSSLFSHDLLPRTSSQTQGSSVALSSPSGPGIHSQNINSSNSGSHSRSSSSGNGSNVSGNSSLGGSTSGSNNFDLGLARSYASMISAPQPSPLFVRSDGTLPRSLPGSSSPFLSQSPGLGAALAMPTGSSRTPTPAHQQSLSQTNFPSIPRDPRDPISQSHPSLQIPSLNSISSSQAPSLSHLNAASLASYAGRDSLALMNQGGRGPLVGATGGLVDPTQQIYQQYLQRQQLAQEELLFRSAGASQLAAHQSMMIQQGLMSAAAAGYPSGYPPSLGLRSGTYQGMNRPWI